MGQSDLQAAEVGKEGKKVGQRIPAQQAGPRTQPPRVAQVPISIIVVGGGCRCGRGKVETALNGNFGLTGRWALVSDLAYVQETGPLQRRAGDLLKAKVEGLIRYSVPFLLMS